MYIFVFICLHILITVIEVRKITSGVDFCFRYRNSHRLEFCVVLFVPFGALEICCFQCHFTITSSLPHHKLIKGDMSCIFSILFKPLNCEYTGHLSCSTICSCSGVCILGGSTTHNNEWGCWI